MVWNLLSMISGRLIVAVILFPQNAKFSINSSKTITLKITFHLKILYLSRFCIKNENKNDKTQAKLYFGYFSVSSVRFNFHTEDDLAFTGHLFFLSINK